MPMYPGGVYAADIQSKQISSQIIRPDYPLQVFEDDFQVVFLLLRLLQVYYH